MVWCTSKVFLTINPKEVDPMNESAVERLSKTHPDMEIWWDSSPLVYNQWIRKMIEAVESSRKSQLAEQLARLYDTEAPNKSIFRGCTTNPPLSWQAVQSDFKFWGDWIDSQILTNPHLTTEQLTWLTYKEVVKRGAEMYMPIF